MHARKRETATGTAEPARGKPVGRPRVPGVDDRILDAALARLIDVGYGRLRMDDVAVDARVAKTTVYRRWTSKQALVADAVSRLYLDRVPPVDLGDLRSDLIALLSETYRLLFEGPGRVLEDLVRESGDSHELAEVVKLTTDVRRRSIHQAMNKGVARGEVDPRADHELIMDLLVGPLWTRRLVTDRSITTADIEGIVDAVLDGVRPRST